MISVYPANARYHAASGWLASNFSFSFGPYYDPQNTRFGPMRVLNDDFIAPEQGFGAHPHSDMEVVSIVLQGQLRHQDNLGNVGVTSWGEIQRMSAGTGIIHTEFSASKEEELNLLQMWFEPDQRGLAPSYEITSFDPNALSTAWTPVVSNHSRANVAHIHQDMTIYLREVAAGQRVDFTTNADRRVFLFIVEGEVALNDDTLLGTRDAARITNHSSVDIRVRSQSLVMLIDLP